MIITKKEVQLTSEYRDILENRMKVLMNESYTMYKKYQNVLDKGYLDIDQDVAVAGGDVYKLHIHLSAESDTVDCSVTTSNGITLTLGGTFGAPSVSTRAEPTEEEAKLITDPLSVKDGQPYDQVTMKPNNPPAVQSYGRGHRIPQEIKDKIAEHLKEGKEYQWIIDTYGISRTTVHNIAISYNIDPSVLANNTRNDNAQKLKKYADDIITDLAKNEMSNLAISNKYQLPHYTISRFKKSHLGAIEQRKKELEQKNYSTKDKSKEAADKQCQDVSIDVQSYIIQDLIDGTMSNIDIAAKYHTNQSTVKRIAELAAYTIKKGKESKSKTFKVPKEDPSNGGPASTESIKQLKNHFDNGRK